MISSRRAEIGRSASCLKTSCVTLRAPAGRASIGTFDFLPQRLLRRKTQALEVLTALRGQALHPAEAALELHVGRAQRRLGIDIELAREIRSREQQIADLLEDLVRRRAGINGTVAVSGGWPVTRTRIPGRSF